MENASFKKLITFLVIVAVVAVLVLPVAFRNDNRPLQEDLFLISDPNTQALVKQTPEQITRSLLKGVTPEQTLLPITVDYPLDNSIFPPEMVAPTFRWHEPHQNVDLWLIDITFQDNPHHVYVITLGQQSPPTIDPEAVSPTNEHYRPSDYDLAAKAWSPDRRTWEIIKKHSIKQPATLTILGFNRGDGLTALSKASLQIMTSKDPVGAPIFYRDVPLMPSETREGVIKPLVNDALPLIAWRLRDISQPSAPIVLKDMPTCGNCHSFSSDGQTLGMDMDGPSGDKGAYAITAVKKNIRIVREDIISWNSYPYKPQGNKTLGLFSQVSPDGQHVVSTVNESIFVANYPDFRFLQSFYPTRGILAIYSKAAGTMEPLPGANDPNYVHSNGCWSPDGKYIVFSRARATDNYISEERSTHAGHPAETPIQYDLYRIPFNDGDGGTAEPVEGASNNRMSNSFPRFSPDGKWIVFVQAKRGQLMRPDGQLHIIPAEGGRPQEMNCNLDCMNSWHSWSPNSRWLVFSSKGLTPFTQMFLTHIDKEGVDSPPILIPNSTAANRAVNIPEFLNNAPDAIVSMSAPSQESYRHFNNANELMKAKRFSQAIVEYDKSIAINPYYSKAYGHKANALTVLGQTESALANYKKAMELGTDSGHIHRNFGVLLDLQGNSDEAMKHFEKALALLPNFASAHNDISKLLFRQGKLDKCAEHLDEVLRLKPRTQLAAEAHHRRGLILVRQGKLDEGLKHYNESLSIDPDYADLHRDLGWALSKQGHFHQAIKHYTEALRLKPDQVQVMNSLAWLFATHPNAGFHDPQRAVHLAKQACLQTHYEVPAFLDTLAAAYAAADKFPQAIEMAQKALRLAQLPQHKQQIEAHLRLYRAGQPCIETALKETPN